MTSTDVVEHPGLATPGSREFVIMVKSGSDARKLAEAIAGAIADKREPVLRAIGAAAVNQAIKAVAIARFFVAERGLDLFMRPSFATTDLVRRRGTGGDESISCLVIRVDTKEAQ